MPPKKATTKGKKMLMSNRVAKMAELLDESVSFKDSVPLSSARDVAHYYTAEGVGMNLGEKPFPFVVPGYNAPTQKMQVFIDRNQPFTSSAKILDPATGLLRETHLGSKKTIPEWLNLFLLSLNGKLEEYKAFQYDPKGAAEFVDTNWSELAQLYTQIRQLSNSQYVNDKQRGKARAALLKIEALAKFNVDQGLAAKIESQGRNAFDRSVALLNDPKSKLSGAEKSALLATLLSIASENSKYSSDKDALMALKTQLATDEKAKIQTEADILIAYIDWYAANDPQHMGVVKNLILEQLRSAKGQFSIGLNTKDWNKNWTEIMDGKNPQTQFSELLITLLNMKQQSSRFTLSAVAKLIESKYEPKKLSAAYDTGSLQSTASREVLSRFSAANEANTTYRSLSKFTAGKVCENIDPKQVMRFFDLYGQYHELMLAVIIYYYTSCSTAYDSKDITPLAEDWVQWLRTGPFHMDLPKVKDMRSDVFNRVAPQAFLEFALDNNWTLGNRMGLTVENAGETQKTFADGFAELLTLAQVIVDDCNYFIKMIPAPGKPKAEMSEQSKRVKFLAQFVVNAGAVLFGMRKGGAMIASWVKEGNVVKRKIAEGTRQTCEFNLENLAKRYTAESGMAPMAPAAPAVPEVAAPAVVAPPPAVLAPPLGAEVPVVLKLKWPGDSKIIAAADASNAAALRWKAENFEIVIPKQDTTESLAQITEAYNIVKIGAPLYVWFNGVPLDTVAFDDSHGSFSETVVSDIPDFFANSGPKTGGSPYLDPLTDHFNSGTLTNGQLVFEVSPYPNQADSDYLVQQIAAAAPPAATNP